jgi:hypothetical protein
MASTIRVYPILYVSGYQQIVVVNLPIRFGMKRKMFSSEELSASRLGLCGMLERSRVMLSELRPAFVLCVVAIFVEVSTLLSVAGPSN